MSLIAELTKNEFEYIEKQRNEIFKHIINYYKVDFKNSGVFLNVEINDIKIIICTIEYQELIEGILVKKLKSSIFFDKIEYELFPNATILANGFDNKYIIYPYFNDNKQTSKKMSEIFYKLYYLITLKEEISTELNKQENKIIKNKGKI